MGCKGTCRQGRAKCERQECKPDPLDLKIAARFILVVVLVTLILMIALMGATWSW